MKLAFVSLLVAMGCTDPTGTPNPSNSDEDGEEIPTPPEEQCTADQHLCGADCTDAKPDDTENGCSLGCGTTCAAPEHGTAVCTSGACDFTCEAPYVRVNDACALLACEDAGYACGDYTLGGETLDCGSCGGEASCTNHAGVIPADASEPNNSAAQATALVAVSDSDPDDTYNMRTELSIDSTLDEDWFRFSVEDSFSTNLGNPDVVVNLEKYDATEGFLSLDSEHEITVWFRCNTQDNGTLVTCWDYGATASSVSDPQLGAGCTIAGTDPHVTIQTSCTTTDDGGTVTVRVRKTAVPRGDTYDLSWYVLPYDI